MKSIKLNTSKVVYSSALCVKDTYTVIIRYTLFTHGEGGRELSLLLSLSYLQGIMVQYKMAYAVLLACTQVGPFYWCYIKHTRGEYISIYSWEQTWKIDNFYKTLEFNFPYKDNISLCLPSFFAVIYMGPQQCNRNFTPTKQAFLF